jgi:hypothetical protein
MIYGHKAALKRKRDKQMRIAARIKLDKQMRIAARIKLDLLGKKHDGSSAERQHLRRLLWQCVSEARRLNREAWKSGRTN